ncbi:uncharacterized protein LOC134278428 [Saccostrea cucullata]|uniref:uncharacterized protein LOC134278428 n=1 Tax=Saccostrea cuccullata TaxID=36930 RepID=UPI002ED2F863
MKKMVAPLISQCAYLCATNDSCQGFHYNKISRECSLYNSQNHRDVGEDMGSKHFQIMPKECVPGIDEWFPDLNKCIHIDTTLVYHSEAQSRCHSLSKDLMSLETIAKYNTVKALLNTFDIGGYF